MATDSVKTGAGTQPTLSATYKSPTNEDFSLSATLPLPPSNHPEARKSYLKELRQAACQIQEQVNKELTARMEDDKARSSAGDDSGAAAATNANGVDEAKEEENYGEEAQGED